MLRKEVHVESRLSPRLVIVVVVALSLIGAAAYLFVNPSNNPPDEPQLPVQPEPVEDGRPEGVLYQSGPEPD